MRAPPAGAVRALLLVAIGLAVLGGLALGCGGSSAPPPRRPDIVVERRACLAEAPPEPPAGIVWTECPGWATCLSDASMRLLWTWLLDLRRYADDAWTTCGPPPAKETPP